VYGVFVVEKCGPVRAGWDGTRAEAVPLGRVTAAVTRAAVNAAQEATMRFIVREFGAEAAAKAARELFGYLVEKIAARRADGGGNDPLAVLLADTGDDRLTEHELLGMCFQFVLAGLDTVTDALSNAFAILATRPDLRQQLVDDPGIIPDAIEELLRIDGPMLEMKAVLEEWHRRIPGYQLAEGVRPVALWPAGLVGVASLPLVYPVEPRPADG
jgi:hypothetical protein